MKVDQVQQVSLHGVFLKLFEVGVCIIGKNGVGKSELGLSLIERDHALIADDSVLFKKKAGQIIGHPFNELNDFMAVRSLGLLNVVKLFGEQSVVSSHELHLLIELTKREDYHKESNNENLQGFQEFQLILGTSIPKVTLQTTPSRNLPLLVEIIAKQYLLKKARYDAYSDFESRQRQLIGNAHS